MMAEIFEEILEIKLNHFPKYLALCQLPRTAFVFCNFSVSTPFFFSILTNYTFANQIPLQGSRQAFVMFHNEAKTSHNIFLCVENGAKFGSI